MQENRESAPRRPRSSARTSDDALRVLPPDPRRLPVVLSADALDRGQREALTAFRTGADVLVHASPGTGRTALALAAALETASPEPEDRSSAGTDPNAAAGGEVLLLSPRRSAADPLRDAVALAGAAGRVRVATPPAFAFAVVRADALENGEGEPSLVTGAEQDALLRDLIAARTDWSLDVEAATRTLPGFRTELRDVLTRAEELGIGPRALRELGHRRERPAWLDAAQLLREYLDVLDLESSAALDAGPRLDSGALVRRSAALVASLDARHLPAAVVVDDAQDLTVAGVALVLALARAGSRVLVTSCPDVMVDSFRGAVADAGARIRAGMPRPMREILLMGAHRGGLPRPALEALRGRLPLAGAPAGARRPVGTEPAAEPDADRGLSVLTLSDQEEEARVIAGVLRDLHHRRQVPYDDMAVVCRSGGAVREIADMLARAGLAVTTPQRLPALREETVVADLLRIVEIGVGAAEAPGTEVDPSEASQLLRGPFGDADDLRLRRIRRALLDAHRGESMSPGPAADSSGLLARALVEEDVPGLEDGGRTATPVLRVRRMIRAVRDLGPSPAAADALWAAWDAAHLAEGWQRAALGEDLEDADGARARLTAHRLDAVGALFAAVDRFTERRPQADALVFLDQIRTQSVAEDTLAPRAEPAGRVAVLTPAQLAGSERDTVVLARVQEGAWPDVRLRSTLFGAAELSLLGTRPDGEELPLEPAALRAVQRESVVTDEVRLALSALTRARRRVLVTAVDGGELAPSVLVGLLRAHAGRPWLDPAVISEDPGPAPDARRLVAALRRRLAAEDPAAREQAAVLLASLRAEGISGAEPATWYHQLPSTDAPVQDEGVPVRLSPSALESAHACPQAWLLERAGGSRPSGPAQLVGTAIHRLAQENPDGAGPDGTEDLLLRLHTLLRPLRLEDTWSGRHVLRRAEDSVRMLEDYLATAQPAVAVEAPFEVTLGRVVLRGAIDRIEGGTGPGDSLRIVDLKTGRSPKTAAAVEEDLQLGAYQTAVAGGALEDTLGTDAGERLAGAQLVYVGTDTAKPSLRLQGALAGAEDPAWFEKVVASVADEVGGSRVTARRNAHCDHCAVRRTCPLWAEGAEL